MDTKHDGLTEVENFFAQQVLPFPYIPPEMRSAIHRIGDGIYGTRGSTHSLYDMAPFVEEAATQPVADYILLGEAGHGFTSHAIHYYLVRGPLAVFIQKNWGGAYTDVQRAEKDIATTFHIVEQLVDAVAAAQQRGVFPPEARLIVTDSSFYGSGWSYFDRQVKPETVFLADRWQTGNNALREALHWVETRTQAEQDMRGKTESS